MRNTLLTTTALVLTAGIASADGHASMSWSGTATAGFARDGKVEAAKAGTMTAAQFTLNNSTTITNTIAMSGTVVANTAEFLAQILDVAELDIHAIETDLPGVPAVNLTSTTLIALRADIAVLRTRLAGKGLTVAQTAALKVRIDKVANMLDLTHATAAGTETATGDYKSYSEVNATVTGSVATDNGMTFSASMSVDAGNGYTFASDKTFDTDKTNGVGLDNITIGTSMGTFKLDQNAIAHLVDGDDDAAADILYTHTFGSASVSVAVDANKDTDAAFVKAAVATIANGAATTVADTDAAGMYTITNATAATAQDVAWSAKVSMPLGSGSAYVAMDEEGGNTFGASATLGGVGITFASKLEALESEQKKDRVNDLGLTYVMGATTMGATWNSVEDKDQWGISAAYAADGMTVKASTDEGSDWSVSGSYLIGTGASVVGGVNYTEDAYLGLSFSF
jgi:hypothetical protein